MNEYATNESKTCDQLIHDWLWRFYHAILKPLTNFFLRMNWKARKLLRSNKLLSYCLYWNLKLAIKCRELIYITLALFWVNKYQSQSCHNKNQTRNNTTIFSKTIMLNKGLLFWNTIIHYSAVVLKYSYLT